MAGLLAQLGRPDVRGSVDEDLGRQTFESYLERPHTMAFVAEMDGRVVGFVNLEFRMRLNFTTPQAWIPDLIVAEHARGEGIGSALLAKCEGEARELGCWSLALESATWRERAHSFYEREGLRYTGKAFSKTLTDIEWPPKAPDEGG